jgi:hypothetical protein
MAFMALGIAWWRIFIVACAVLPIVAFWTVVVMNAVYPWWWSIAIYYYNHAVYQLKYGRILRRMDNGLCPHCAYNLRGNTTGICSECGEEIDFIPPRILPSEENRSRRSRGVRVFPGNGICG